MEKLRALLHDKERRQEIFWYLVIGILATVVNLAVYHGLRVAVSPDAIVATLLGQEIQWFQVASGLSWVAAVLFAYAGNKLLVFKSRGLRRRELIREMLSFFGARVMSLVLFDIAGMTLCVKAFGMNDMAAKLLMNILVIIFNYAASKLVVFKRKG